MDRPQHLQSFRIAPQCFSSTSSYTHNPVHTLPTRLDPKTENHFILWRDIQAFFKNAQGVLADGVAVYFTEGDNFQRLEPLRIAYHPGTTLEVVVPTIELGPSSGLGTTLAAVNTQGATIALSSSVDLEKQAARLRIQDIPDPAQEDSNPSSTNVVSNTKGKRSEARLSLTAQSSVQVFQGLRASWIQAITSGQVNQAESIKAEMSKHFQEVKVETDKLNASMEENAVLQAKLLDMNRTMFQMQKMTLDRLANIQGQIQAVLTQTYELHEFPIPRLFIILPTVARRRDVFFKPFSNQFRLYFLCECGSHTTREGSKEIDKVHLADHPGYDIEQPTRFFKKFGPYVLAVMRAIQLGARVTSVVIPHLANSSLVQELNNVESSLASLQKGIDFYSKESIGAMVDQTVSFLEGFNQRHGELVLDGKELQTTISRLELNDAEAIEGVELKQLENFLSVADKERTLGNLYRSVTKEGHVKWVCRTHFRQNYGEQARKRLLEVVQENDGIYDEQRGKVVIQLATKTLAKAFYSVLVQTPNIQELDIALLWDASLSDLRSLAEAILKSTVVVLCIDGSYFTGPIGDILNSSRRYEPFLQLMTKGQLQAIQFQVFLEFFDRVGNLSTIISIPSLRALNMCNLPNASYEGLLNLVGKCTGLQRLTLGRPGIDQAVALLRANRRILEMEVSYPLSHISMALGLASEIANLKDQDKGDHTGNRLRLQSLVARQDVSFCAPCRISSNDEHELVPGRVSFTFSEDGITGISSDDWGVVDIKPFVSQYGWALLDADLLQFQLHEATRSEEKRLPLDYGAWSKLIDRNGGISALKSLRYHGSLLIEEDRPALLSIIDKSPKLECLEVIFSSRHDREVVFWHLEHLASRISTLQLLGHTCFKSFVDFITQHEITLPKLTELRCRPNLIPHDSHKMTRERWSQLFATVDFSVLTILTINMDPIEELWSALLDSLPKDGILSNGQPVALTTLRFRFASVVSGRDYRLKCQQLSEKAPFATLDR